MTLEEMRAKWPGWSFDRDETLLVAEANCYSGQLRILPVCNEGERWGFPEAQALAMIDAALEALKGGG